MLSLPFCSVAYTLARKAALAASCSGACST
jgi:hypothetical protein